MKNICQLPGCYRYVPEGRKNGLYCCDQHQYSAKKLRNQVAYEQLKQEKTIDNGDNILAHLYQLYNSRSISSQMLEDLKFPWQICTTKLLNGNYFHQVKYFGFILFLNHTLKIYKT